MIEFPELKDDDVFKNQIDISFYSNQLFEEWKKINNLAKKAEIVSTLLSINRTEDKPYFHIEWIMDNVFKLSVEDKTENERYWAKDASALRANADNNEMGSGMNSDMGDMSGMNDNSMETQDNTVNDAEFNADNSSSEPPIDNSNGEQESNEFEF